MSRRLLAALALAGLSPQAQAADPPEKVTFQEAVQRATERHPTAKQAAQAILRAQGLLDLARSVFLPTLYGDVDTSVLDAARGFDGNVVQPRTQTRFSGTLSFPFLAAASWARKNQAADQVETARVSAAETRRQVAVTAAQAYLAVIAAQRQREIATRNRDTASALAEYSRARLEAGQGSRLNHLRSSQELASAEGFLQAAELSLRRAQEALGVAVFAEAPLDANGHPELPPAAPAADQDAWLLRRPDVRLSMLQLQAAERVVSDTWKSWLPTGTARFTPQYVTPAGLFEPARSWRAVFEVDIPLFDGALGAAKRIRIADRESAKLGLDAVKLQARAELRVAQESVSRHEQISASSRQAAENALEALRITEIAYRAGATSNIEVVQAQQTARNAETVAAQGEDRLRQARLDLLVALGRFPE